MKKITMYFCSLLFIIGMVCSCSSAPDYGKMVPKDAYFVMTLDVEEAVKSSDLGEAKLLKEQIDKSLAHAKLPHDTREQLEDIIDDPLNTGFDFKEPMMVFASSNFTNRFGILGAVSNEDKLEDFLNILSKEDVCAPVLETDGLRYTTFDRGVLAFNADWFFITERVFSQNDEKDVLKEINLLAQQKEEKSLQSNEVFRGMTHREGFMHMLFLGKGLEDLAKEMGSNYKNVDALFGKDVKLADFALVCDAAIQKGEMKLVSETLPLTAEAKDWVDENMAYGKLEGNLVDYVPEDVLFYGFSNAKGALALENIKKQPQYQALQQTSPKVAKVIEAMVSACEGDVAMSIGKQFSDLGFPEVSVYASTTNGEWLDLLANEPTTELQKIDDNTYSLSIPDTRYSAYYTNGRNGQNAPAMMTIVVGTKKGISYCLVGKDKRTLEKVANPVSVDKNLNAYGRLAAEQLVAYDWLKKEMGPLAFIPFKKVVNLFDCAEMEMEDGRKVTFRLVMKNKDQSPVRTIYDEVEKVLQLLS